MVQVAFLYLLWSYLIPEAGLFLDCWPDFEIVELLICGMLSAVVPEYSEGLESKASAFATTQEFSQRLLYWQWKYIFVVFEKLNI